MRVIKSKIMEESPYGIEWKVENFHWWFVVRRRLLKSLLSSIHLSSKCVTLDIGCSVGSNLRIFKSANLNIIGLDRSLYAISLARKRFKFDFINGDMNQLSIKPQSVGLIVAGSANLKAIDTVVVGLGTVLQAILANIVVFIAPAVIVVGLKAVYSLAKAAEAGKK